MVHNRKICSSLSLFEVMNRARRVLALTLPVGYYLTTKRRAVNANTALVNQQINIEEFTSPQDTYKIKLYGYNGCPYRGKVMAFLNYYGYEFEQVEINPFTKAELKDVTPGYKKSPCLQITDENGNQVGDFITVKVQNNGL